MARREQSRSDDLAVDAEAAAWLARLRHEGRTEADEAGFRKWLTEDVRHQHAFDEATTVWQMAGGLKHRMRRAPAPRRAPALSRRTVLAGGGVALAAGVAGLALVPMLGREAVYAAGFGEQRRVGLADGTLMILDSETEVHARLTGRRRTIRLVRGRAHFDVAKDARRPFVVEAGDRQVVAVGTSFDVTRGQGAVTVTLTEGRVVVQPAGAPTTRSGAAMSPGDRIVFAGDGQIHADRPDLAKATAWQSGRVIFDDELMSEAVAQMNRYSRRRLVIADPAVASMRISGIYTAGDADAFATSISLILPIQVARAPERLVLTEARPPGAALR